MGEGISWGEGMLGKERREKSILYLHSGWAEHKLKFYTGNEKIKTRRAVNQNRKVGFKGYETKRSVCSIQNGNSQLF